MIEFQARLNNLVKAECEPSPVVEDPEAMAEDAINATNIGEVSRMGHNTQITVNEDRSNRGRWRQARKHSPWFKIDEVVTAEEEIVTLPSRSPSEAPPVDETMMPTMSRGSSTSTIAIPLEVEINYASATCDRCFHLFSQVPERSIAKFCRKCGLERDVLTDTAPEPSPISDVSPAAADYGEAAEEAPCTEEVSRDHDSDFEIEANPKHSYVALEMVLYKRPIKPSGIESLYVDRLRKNGVLFVKSFVDNFPS